MNHTLQLEEIQHHLSENSDSIIWSQKVSSKTRLTKRILHTFGIVFLITLYSIGQGIDRSDLSFFWVSIILFFSMSSFMSHEILKTYVFATIVYSIRPNHITFEWGHFKKKRIDIPFKEITAINLVGYQDKTYSTIHFGTTKSYEDILRVNFNDFDSRAHITFERVEEGQKVYDLLQYLKNSASNK